MSKRIQVHNLDELNRYKIIIMNNLDKSVEQIKNVIDTKSSLEIFQCLKFDKCVTEPLLGQTGNVIEVINQSMTYLVSFLGVEILFGLYPDKAFNLNLGNVPGYDIESVDCEIVAECFAATSYSSNQKLVKDLKRLHGNGNAKYKYGL